MSPQEVKESTAISPESEQDTATAESTPGRLPLGQLQEGMQYEGIVRNLQPYGAFVDIGAERDGLLHISQVGEGFVQRLEDVLHIGQSIVVWVRDVDEERGRVRLTTRMPGQTLVTRKKLDDLIEGEVMEGRVCSITQFGAFVDIGAETDGLVHVSELSTMHVNHPADIVSRGERVRVRILNVDIPRHRIGLTMKNVDSDDPDPMEENQPDVMAEAQPDSMPTAVEIAFREAQTNNNSEHDAADNPFGDL
ncbi:MAG: 30S ribosomal protein S1 [Chloroflexi bacterium]|nr:30S ribosomal protein S1 [Chloroflexota bacterium]